MDAKKQAAKFIKEFSIQKPDIETMKRTLARQGYVIIRYRKKGNREDVEQLLFHLGLNHISETADSFTYADGNRRIVFLREFLSEKEELYLLQHEEGHIYLNHVASSSTMGHEDILHEQAADQFAVELVKMCETSVNKKKRYFAVITVIITFIFAIYIAFPAVDFYNPFSTGMPDTTTSSNVLLNDQAQSFYWTAGGKKYHIRDNCYTIQDSKYPIQHGTLQDAHNDGKDEPCKVCIGD